jgi:hypothetical protein
VEDRQAPDAALALDEVDDAPGLQLGDRQAGEADQRGLEVERRGQEAARLGQDAVPVESAP